MSIFSKITSMFKLEPIKSKLKNLDLGKIKPSTHVQNTASNKVKEAKEPIFTDNKSLLIYYAKENGITNKNELAMFLAQLDHESSSFRRLEESFNYRPENLLKVFPRYVKDLRDAQSLVSRGPAAIANRVYGNRMGNNDTGDGYKYRGRGFIQLTGKNNYSKYQGLTRLPILSNPDLLLNPKEAAIVSISYWKNTPGIVNHARMGNVVVVSSIINTGNPNTPRSRINGLQDRINKFTKYTREV